MPPLVDQRQEALPAPPIDPTPAFLALTDAIDRLASRVHDIESLPIYGLSGREVIKALRSGQAQRNALFLDE